MTTCPACGFENFGQSRLCGRCGAKLAWETSWDPEDFQPPRAGGGLTYSLRRLWFRLTGAPSSRLRFLVAWPEALVSGWSGLPGRRRLAAALSIIPGGGHFFLGEFRTGGIFLAAWLAILLIFFFLRTNAHQLPIVTAAAIRAGAQFFVATAAVLWLAALLTQAAAAVSAARPGRHCRTRLETRAVALSLISIVFIGYLIAVFLFQDRLTFYVVRPIRY